MCDRKGNCLKTFSNSQKIHENFGLKWKATKKELLFQNWMKLTPFELIFHPLNTTKHKFDKANHYCNNVC